MDYAGCTTVKRVTDRMCAHFICAVCSRRTAENKEQESPTDDILGEFEREWKISATLATAEMVAGVVN